MKRFSVDRRQTGPAARSATGEVASSPELEDALSRHAEELRDLRDAGISLRFLGELTFQVVVGHDVHTGDPAMREIHLVASGVEPTDRLRDDSGEEILVRHRPDRPDGDRERRARPAGESPRARRRSDGAEVTEHGGELNQGVIADRVEAFSPGLDRDAVQAMSAIGHARSPFPGRQPEAGLLELANERVQAQAGLEAEAGGDRVAEEGTVNLRRADADVGAEEVA